MLNYFSNTPLVGGTSYPLLFLALYLSGFNPYLFIILFYMSLIMPLVMIFVRELPFEKGIGFVLFSPFIAFQSICKNFLNLLNSLRTMSFSKRSGRIALVSLALLVGFGVLFFVPSYFWGIEKGGTIAVTIAMLFFLITAYQVLSITYFRDRKYNKVWKKWLSEFHKEISIDEIIAVLSLISTRFAYKLIEKIREDDMLQPSQENLYFIKQLIRLVENPFLDNEFSEPLSVFLDDIGENKLKPMLLDELFQLIEKISSKLQ